MEKTLTTVDKGIFVYYIISWSSTAQNYEIFWNIFLLLCVDLKNMVKSKVKTEMPFWNDQQE